MRIVAWNCRQALDRKAEALLELGPDIAIVPECARESQTANRPDVTYLWEGENPKKGLGVFGFNGWTLNRIHGDPLRGLLPLTASRPGHEELTVLAVWTKQAPGSSYTLQMSRMIEAWSGRISSRSVVAGDLNASIQGPSRSRHAANLDRLSELSVESAYHHLRGISHGGEPDMTLRWVGPGRKRYEYHCDFVFLSADLLTGLRRADVGPMDRWVDSGLSDHCPVIVDVDL